VPDELDSPELDDELETTELVSVVCEVSELTELEMDELSVCEPDCVDPEEIELGTPVLAEALVGLLVLELVFRVEDLRVVDDQEVYVI
jgi:hypothetical protein